MLPSKAAAELRAKLILDAAHLRNLVDSAQESILIGDYAQALGNLEALSSIRVQLVIACSEKVREEHTPAI